MKKISVCKNQQIIFNHIVPTGAVYGKVTVSFDRHIKTGVKFVTDKNGVQLFNKNGTPKMRIIWKTIPTKTTVIYSVESFLSYSFKGEKDRHMYAWVLFEGSSKWTEVALCGTPVYQSIETMVRDYINENGLKEPKIASVKDKTIVGTPKRRQANKFDNVFRMRPDYSGTINEEVRPRMPMVHSNMNKLHPLDERPMVTVKAKSPKLDKYVKYTRTITVKGEGGKEYTITEKITDTK